MFKKELLTMENTVVHCPEEWQAEKFVAWLREQGQTWSDTYWDDYKQETCYWASENEYADIGFYLRVNLKVIPYEEALAEPEFKLGDEVWVFQKTAKGWEDKNWNPKKMYYGGSMVDCCGVQVERLLANVRNSDLGMFFAKEDFILYSEYLKNKEGEKKMTETEKEIVKLKEQVVRLEEAVKKEKETPKLHLEVNLLGSLLMLYGGEIVGVIFSDGECHILSNISQRETWEEWYKAGKSVDETKVSWRGKTYMIDSRDYCLKNTDSWEDIYDFEYCNPVYGCEDENIKRYSNGTPILY